MIARTNYFSARILFIFASTHVRKFGMGATPMPHTCMREGHSISMHAEVQISFPFNWVSTPAAFFQVMFFYPKYICEIAFLENTLETHSLKRLFWKGAIENLICLHIKII